MSRTDPNDPDHSNSPPGQEPAPPPIQRPTALRCGQAEVRLVPDAAQAGRVAAELLTQAARDAVAARGRFTLAIPGGSSPRAAFDELIRPERAGAFPWALTDLLWVDERAVPVEHPDSNYGAFARDALPRLAIREGRVHRMRGELGAADGAADYARTLRSVLGTRTPHASDLPASGSEPAAPLSPIDLVLLGIGEDGHVASLFPGAASLHATEPVLPITDSPKPPPQRITLSLPLLRAARRLVLLALGAAKAHAVARCLAGEPLPARLAADTQRALWVVDQPAAQRLPP